MDPFRWNGLDRSIVAIDDWCVSEQKQIASGDVKQFANWKMAIEIVDLWSPTELWKNKKRST